MKKTYIQPDMTMVVLTHIHIIAASDTGLRTSENDASDAEVLVKKYTFPEHNLWDDEW